MPNPEALPTCARSRRHFYFTRRRAFSAAPYLGCRARARLRRRRDRWRDVGGCAAALAAARNGLRVITDRRDRLGRRPAHFAGRPAGRASLDRVVRRHALLPRLPRRASATTTAATTRSPPRPRALSRTSTPATAGLAAHPRAARLAGRARRDARALRQRRAADRPPAPRADRGRHRRRPRARRRAVRDLERAGEAHLRAPIFWTPPNRATCCRSPAPNT